MRVRGEKEIRSISKDRGSTISSSKQKVLIVVSYWSGGNGGVCGAWTRDKVTNFSALGYRVCLITAEPNDDYTGMPNVSVRLVSSISRRDYVQERNLASERGLSNPLSFLLSIILGRPFDALFKALAGEYSVGRYSWAVSALPVVIGSAIRHRTSQLVSLGGPTSAHLCAAIASRLTRKRLVSEFQDPLIGAQMKVNSLAKFLLVQFESLILRQSRKFVMTSRQPFIQFKSRNKRFSQRIHLIYPYARPISVNDKEARVGNYPRRIFHIGTLYGSRNLDNLFSALDFLYESGVLASGELKVTNIGHIDSDLFLKYSAREDFESLGPMTRQEALNLPSSNDLLILVQHLDSRSLETVPFKLYDYINIDAAIVSLSSNSEIEEILRGSKANYVLADPSVVESISSALAYALKNEVDVISSRARTNLSLHASAQLLADAENCDSDLCDCDFVPSC